MQHLDLFSGIGGFALAADRVFGKKNVTHTFCDNDPFCQAILKKHWPTAEIYCDIRTLAHSDFRKSNARNVAKPKSKAHKKSSSNHTVDLVTGGFPCQPFSAAGRRKGTQDDRHLWPEMLRIIKEFRPRWVIGENVGGFVTWNQGMVLEQVHADLEAAGYEVQAFIIPAVALNAPHRRDRVWIVGWRAANNVTHHEKFRARRNQEGQRQRGQRDRDGSAQRRSWNQNWLEVATRLCTMDDGLPNGLARPKGWRNAALKGAGNAIVPQVAMQIMQAIKQTDEQVR